MKTKSTVVPVLGILLAGSLATNAYLLTQSSDGNEPPPLTHCSPDESPRYTSVTFEEAKERHQQYIRDRVAGDENATRSVWVSFEDLENYICVVRNAAGKYKQPQEGLGMRMYFTRYENENKVMQDNLTFVPGNMVGGEPDDWSEDILRSRVRDSDKSFLMNRFRPCPSSCGNSELE